MRTGIVIRAFALVLLATTVACGPQISKKTRLSWAPFDSNEFHQTRSGVTVENKEVKEFPASMVVQTPACGANGVPIFDEKAQPVVEKATFAQPGQVWYQVSVTNDTDHILRLGSTVIRLFDPAGNQIEPLGKDDVLAEFVGNCLLRGQSADRLRLVKFLDRNVEIVPKTTVTAWLAFHPPSADVPGTWKLALYELPVEMDDAGKVTRTERFEVRSIVKKFEDTFQADSPFEEARLVGTQELTE
jgi:hypothetical protein